MSKDKYNVDEIHKKYISTISEDTLATTLRFHLLTEHYLEEFIKSALPNGYKIVESNNFSYIHKLNIVDATCSLNEKYINSLKNLNKLRNRCSHQLEHVITNSDLETVGSPLGKTWTKIKREKTTEQSRQAHLFGHIVAGLTVDLTELEKKAKQ